MKRFWLHVLMVVLALVSCVILSSFATVILNKAAWLSLVLVIAIPVAVLMRTIFMVKNGKSRLLLTYSISLLCAQIITIVLFLAALIFALKNFT